MQRQILIVEDSQINREILSMILSDQYRVLEAENGQVALDMLADGKNHVALILLDLDMPVMDGYTFLDRIKDDPELSLIPVIVTTGNNSEADEVDALAHGATDFVPKPYRPQVILHRVASLISLRENAAMVNQLQYDRLTGLYSKDFFFRKVQEQLEAEPDHNYSIVCSNVENFKLFNDIFGSKEGDLLLQELAHITKAMVGDTGFCGRFTADRFLCFQDTRREREDRQTFGNFPKDIKLSSRAQSIVMRWGVYEITDRFVPVEQMCDRALLAADSIKGQYDKSFALYDDSLRQRLMHEKLITDAMKVALEKREFTVHLQPKYRLDDGRMAGAEALVRWKHPEWGMVSPGQFIPLFEKNGFIFQLDRYIWECACMLLRSWQDAGMPVVPVSVNVSRADIFHPQLVETLVELTSRHGIEPALLHLEITEMSYGESPRQLTSAVEQLRNLGFIVEMDDFCSGYSSLSMLSQMELDLVKLDLDFVQSETAKSAGNSILGDIVRAAHRLRLSVVAEGVETREQLERLKAANCDYVQGHYFAKAMPVDEFEKLLVLQAPREEEPPALQPCEACSQIERPKRLLLVEEDAPFRSKAHEALQMRYDVKAAVDAPDALAFLASAESNDLAAVVLSMTLPDNGASAVLRALRRDPTKWQVPVLATIPQCDVTEELPLTLDTDDFLCKCHPVSDLRKRVNRLIGQNQCRNESCAMRSEANRDYLTGLLNRRGLQAELASLYNDELPLALCLFDLDNLKAVNDGNGHNAGDVMIRSFADLLRTRTRNRDILCRYGGDEFLAVLKRVGDADAALRKCQDICRSFSEQFAVEDGTASCSAGIALLGRGDATVEEAIAQADEALYRAKRECKGLCVLWEPER